MKNRSFSRFVRVLVLAAAAVLLLSGCCLSHDWQRATCTAPETCSKCGETRGAALGHSWMDADCVDPKICFVCGQTEGAALGHKWTEATCLSPRKCVVCAQTEGELGSHGNFARRETNDYIRAVVVVEQTCGYCGQTENLEEPMTTMINGRTLVLSVGDFYERMNRIAAEMDDGLSVRISEDSDGDACIRVRLNGKLVGTVNFKDRDHAWISYNSRYNNNVISEIFLYGSNDVDEFLYPWLTVIFACDPAWNMDSDGLLELLEDSISDISTSNGLVYEFTDMTDETGSYWLEVSLK